MFTVFGIVLLVAGAILTFAVDRQADGVDLLLTGWILMAGGGLSLFVGAVRAAGLASSTRRATRASGDAQHRFEESGAETGDSVRAEQERRAA